MLGVGSYLRAQIEEIAADAALRLYGIALLATHVLTAIWFLTGSYSEMARAGEDAICWPLVPDCERFRLLSSGQLDLLMGGYGVAALLGMALFARRRWTAPAWAGLALLTLLKLAVLALDFRLRLNQHYMSTAACAVFLFVPRKRASLQLMLVLFYFWAGTLKLNWEWVSGAALYKPLWLLTGPAVVAACAYVVVIELVVVWGLLARRPAVFWPCLGQVLLFHVMSFAIVGWFYPLLMFALLAVFPLARELPGATPESVGEQILARRLPRPALALAGVVSLAQISTHFYPGDTAITGEGRLYALHMFDARVVCEAEATLKMPDGNTISANIEIETIRLRCDPLMIHGIARNLCRHRAAGQLEIVDLDLHLRSRRTTASEFQQVIDYPNFCSQLPRYEPFLHNSWINPSG